MPLPIVPENLPQGVGSTVEIDRSRALLINYDFVKAVSQSPGTLKSIATRLSNLVGAPRITDSSFSQPTRDVVNMLQPTLERVGLALEVLPDTESGRNINNTPWQIWVRTLTGAAITGNTVDALPGLLQSTLKWTNSFLAPVYRCTNTTDSSSLVSPLPHVLVLKGQPDKKSELLQALEHYQLVEAPISKYFAHGFFCFLLKDLQNRTVYDLPDLLLDREWSLIESVWLDFMPAKRPTAVGFIPTDVYYKDQWNLDKIEAQGGWNVTNPPLPIQGESVIVAVIDSGCDLNHPDLGAGTFESQGAMFTMGSEVPGANGSFEPGESHGTQCTGIIAARYSQSEGLAGLAGKCKVLPIRIDTWEPTAITAAIGYAVQNRARVINMSFAGLQNNPNQYNELQLKQRIQQAFTDENVVLCVATQNEEIGTIYHPAAHPNVIACGASTRQDTRLGTSNYGEDPNLSGDNLSGGFLSVMAPGIDIVTTANTGGGNSNDQNYTLNFRDTSAATPHVAALAALLLSAKPALTSQQVRDIIETTADKVPVSTGYSKTAGKPNGPWNNELGYGRINVRVALEKTLQVGAAPSAPINLRVS